MPLRSLFDFIFASPVMLVSVVLSIASASILVLSISSNVDDSVMDNGVVKNSAMNSGSRAGHIPQSYSQSGSNTGVDVSGAGYNQQSVSGNAAVKPARKYNDRNRQGSVEASEQYYPASLAKDQHDNGDDFSATTNSVNRQSLFNYSNASSSGTSGTGNAVSNSVSSETSVPSATSDVVKATPVATPDSGENTGANFPPSMEEEVITDLGVTQTISCRPVVANGPPCMCTITTNDTNTNRVVSVVDDNCS